MPDITGVTGSEESQDFEGDSGDQGQKVNSGNYDLHAAVNEAFKVEKKAEVTTDVKPDVKTEVKDTKPEIPEDYRLKADFYDNFMKDREVQKNVLHQLAKSHGFTLSPLGEMKQEIKTTLGLDDSKIQEIIASLDPDVKQALDFVYNQSSKPLMEKLSAMESYINEQKESVQRLAQEKAQTEFNEFVSENKEKMEKYGKAMMDMAREYPDFLKKGKKGLQRLLNIVSEDDRMTEKIEDAVAKALGKASEVGEKVKRFSSTTSQGQTHKVTPNIFESLEDAFADAVNQHTKAV